jgi:hypothetical protein
MRKVYLGLAALAVVLAIALWWALRSRPIDEAYVLTPKTAIWSRLAVVREPLVELRYGQRLDVLERRDVFVRARTEAGITGWIEARHLIPRETWQRATALRRQAAALPVQSSGSTKVRTNVRLEPGRGGTQIFQFLADSTVEILERRVVEWTPPEKAPHGEEAESGELASKKEDWLLVRGTDSDSSEVAGWVLGRFLSPNYPQALLDYAGANRFIAWFQLADTPSSFGPRPTWLAAGVTGAEGQPCDFTLLRVYTWNANRARYETAYVESDLCGRLPVRVKPAAKRDPRGEASFTFAATGAKGKDESRTYQLRQNIVRRVRQ